MCKQHLYQAVIRVLFHLADVQLVTNRHNMTASKNIQQSDNNAKQRKMIHFDSNFCWTNNLSLAHYIVDLTTSLSNIEIHPYVMVMMICMSNSFRARENERGASQAQDMF